MIKSSLVEVGGDHEALARSRLAAARALAALDGPRRLGSARPVNIKRMLGLAGGLYLSLAVGDAEPARADGPAASNGWNWMASFSNDSPACHGDGYRLHCFWRRLYSNALTNSLYTSGGAFPAPTSLDGVLTSAPHVGGISVHSTGGTPHTQTVSVRGTDNAVWLREYTGGVFGPWYSLGGVIMGRPACSAVGSDSLICAVRGTDSGIWVNGRGADGKFFGWGRVDNLDGSPRLNVRSSPAVISMLGGGMTWMILFLGDEVGTGKRELWAVRDYGLGSKRAGWLKLGVVDAAIDSDINCPADQLSGVKSCVVRTVTNDANVIAFSSSSVENQRIVAKPEGFPIVGTPTLAFFRNATRGLTAIGIQTVQNHFWLRSD